MQLPKEIGQTMVDKNTMEKTKDRATRTPQKRDMNSSAPEGSSGACVTDKNHEHYLVWRSCCWTSVYVNKYK